MRWDLDLNPIAHSRCGTILNGFRYRVAAPSIRIVPWAALASCWPLPQQLLPVSTAGGGRRRCALAIFSGKLFLIRDSETPAGVSESPFHRWGREGQQHLQHRFLRKRGAVGSVPPVKKQLWKIRRFSRVANIKIFFPLFMRKANAERIPNRFFFNLRTKPPRVCPPGALLCCNREMKVLL